MRTGKGCLGGLRAEGLGATAGHSSLLTERVEAQDGLSKQAASVWALWAANKALGFSFPSLSSSFHPASSTWFPQRWAGWIQALEAPTAFPPSALNFLKGQS